MINQAAVLLQYISKKVADQPYHNKSIQKFV